MPVLPAIALPAFVDCLVVGGGPAGASLSGLLARDGMSVVLIDDGAPRPGSPLETLLPSALRALDRCGLAEAVARCSEVDRRRHGAMWDTEAIVWRDETRAGLCLRRPEFDTGLRTWAAANGAVVLCPATARTLPVSGSGEVTIAHAGREHTLTARTIAIATGRRSVATRCGVAVVEEGPRTAAFAFRVESAHQATNTAMVAAAPDGWCWWIGDDRKGVRIVATVDAEAPSEPIRAVVDRVLLHASRSTGLELPNRPEAAVRATARRARTENGFFLVGDAAATLDPLASQGTEKALVGAEAAALAIRTALQHETLRPLALVHHRAWEHSLFAAHRRTTAEFYARVQRYADRPFWAKRAAVAAPFSPAPVPASLVRSQMVHEAPMLLRHGRELVVTTGFAFAGNDPIARIGRVAIAPLMAAF
ncbi:MAG: FAD-dependent monooxygenase, partial [Planctomycetota bacterium]